MRQLLYSGLLLTLVGGCGGGAKYTTKQAKTNCPTERSATDLQRERLLELGESKPDKGPLARAVFAHGRCEHTQLEQMEISGDSGAAQQQFQTALNLYAEIENYGIVRWRIGALAYAGALYELYSAKLRAVTPQTDDLNRTANILEDEAGAIYAAATELALVVPPEERDGELAAWLEIACAGLQRRAPHQRLPLSCK